MFTDADVERFWSKVAISVPTECWEWQGGKSTGGYGLFYAGDLRFRANRAALAFTTERHPAGLFSLHSCDNRSCCNPHHLRWGTYVDNAQDAVERRRQINARKTHCPRGHAYAGENLRICVSGYRRCRECIRIYNQEDRKLQRFLKRERRLSSGITQGEAA